MSKCHKIPNVEFVALPILRVVSVLCLIYFICISLHELLSKLTTSSNDGFVDLGKDIFLCEFCLFIYLLIEKKDRLFDRTVCRL